MPRPPSTSSSWVWVGLSIGIVGMAGAECPLFPRTALYFPILKGPMWVGWPEIERTKTASGCLWCWAEEPVPLGKIH
eukprot:1144073-Pelagomonas_calceolata.AAC.3